MINRRRDLYVPSVKRKTKDRRNMRLVVIVAIRKAVTQQSTLRLSFRKRLAGPSGSTGAKSVDLRRTA